MKKPIIYSAFFFIITATFSFGQGVWIEENWSIEDGGLGFRTGIITLDGKNYNITPGADLSNIDFKATDLSSVNLNGADLSRANLSQANLENSSLVKVNLNKAVLTGTNLKGITTSNIQGNPLLPEQWVLIRGYLIGQKVNLANTKLEGIDLSGLDLREVNFKGAILKGINLAGTNLSNSDFEGADLEGANLSNTLIRSANFDSVNLTNATLDRATIEDVRFNRSIWNNVDFKNLGFTDNLNIFSDADLRGALFSGANLNDKNLTGAILIGVDFTETLSIERANFSGTNLENANFENTNLNDSEFWGANLRNVSFENADLRNTSFYRTELLNVNFKGTNLTGARIYYGPIDGSNFTGALTRNLELHHFFEPPKNVIGLGETLDLNARLTRLEELLQETEVQRDLAISQRDERPTTQELATITAERDSRPTQDAYNAVIAERDARPTTDELATIMAERDSRPTQDAYNAVIAERDAKIEKINELQSIITANDTIITELEKRPTVEELAAVTAERDARPNIEQIQDARNGSLIINSENGRATISFNIEESEDLKSWQTTGEKITKIIQLKDGKKFYRFALDK